MVKKKIIKIFLFVIMLLVLVFIIFTTRKAIILAGGKGTRLYPLTKAVSKQLHCIYDKPMIYYPMSLVMLSNIKDVLIISDPYSLPMYQKLFEDGKWLGMNISYAEQHEANGLAQAFVIGEKFIGNDSVALFLGDNIFYGAGLSQQLNEASSEDLANSGYATIFGYEVVDPRAYGVVELDQFGYAKSLEEKPQNPKSNLAVPGIYFYPNNVVDIAKNLKPSSRGEYEITDVNRFYMDQHKLVVKKMQRGIAWLDSGTFNALNDASNFVRTIQERTGLKIADIEEIAKQKQWV